MVWSIETGPRVGYWVAGKLNRGYLAERANAVGLTKDGVIVSGVIYENWNQQSIHTHIYAEALTRPFLWAMFDYPFTICGVHKLIAITASTNGKINRLLAHMGFTEEARITDAVPGGDALIHTMEKTACRFLDKRYEP